MPNHQRPANLHLTRDPSTTDEPETGAIARIFRPIVLLEPDRTVLPPSWLEHVPFAFWLIDVLRPRVFVELGTYSGNSYAAFGQAVQHLGLNTAGYAIDTWKGDPHAGFYDESVFTEWRDYHDRRYSSFSTIVRSTFDEAVAHFADRSIDLLNIDGYHTVDAVNHDFHTWLPKVSSRGVVLMHDINVREGDFGAWRAWAQLRDAYPSFEFLHGHGLGVLAVGSDIPPDVAWLTALRATESSSIVAVRQFFARIGGAAMARHRAVESQLSVESVLHAQQFERDRQLADLSERLAEAETRDQISQREREARDALVADLDARLAAAEVGTRAAMEALLKRGEETADLRAKLEAADARDQERKRELTSLSKDLDNARNRMSELHEEISRQSRARLRHETLLRLASDSYAAASGHLENLRGRLRVMAGAVGHRSRPLASRAARMWDTLRSLGVTPGCVVRSPATIATLARLVLRPHKLREAHVIAHSGLFDPDYYGRHSPDVAARGLSPLAHFVLAGGAEGRSPHPLFDSTWYLAQYPDVASARSNPLAHYLRIGAREGRDPHPLFSARHYRLQISHSGVVGLNPLQHYVAHGVFEGLSPHPLFDPKYYIETYGQSVASIDPFVHFLETGAAADFNPHPLFDVAYYRAQVPELEGSGENPLLHYLRLRPSRNRRPHPLFDPIFYVTSYKDVSAAGLEPLTHFVTSGGAEGRRPSLDFDSEWYLATYPDVARTGANPLVHFVRYGWLERRNASPRFDTLAYLNRYPDIARSPTNPLVHYLEHGHAEGRIGLPEEPELSSERGHDASLELRVTNLDGAVLAERVIVCLTHVMPVPPRAGNEYRIHRMLRWLRQSGYVIIPIVAPTDGTRPTSADIRALADEYGNAVVCLQDGHLEYVLRHAPDVLQSLNGEFPRRWAAVLGEDYLATEREREILQIERTFCTDALIATVMRLQSVLGPYVLLAEYIWMSRVLPLVGSRALKIIDTIDVFSTRAEKVGQYGIDDLAIEPEEERVRLARADLIVAIQENERTALEMLVPGIPAVTCGVDFDIRTDPAIPSGHRVLYVASGNPMNRRGLRDFLRFAWPRVRSVGS